MHIEVRGQLEEVTSPLLLHGTWALNSSKHLNSLSHFTGPGKGPFFSHDQPPWWPDNAWLLS